MASDMPQRRTRAERAVLKHDLPPYKPEVGDIVVIFHVFGDAEELEKNARRGERRKGKFRPGVVMACKDNEMIVTPVSSLPHRDMHHLEISEPAELRELGLYEGKPSYAKVLETAKYDVPNPLIQPTLGPEDTPVWSIGKVPKHLRLQILAEMARQKKHGRFLEAKDRRAAHVPQTLVDEMHSVVRAAQAQFEPRRKLPPGVTRAAVGTAPQDQTSRDQTSSDQTPETFAPKASHGTIAFPERQTATRDLPDTPAAPSADEARDARVKESAEALARRRGEHPEQIAEARDGAKKMAQSRGIDPEARAKARSRDDTPSKD